MFNLHIGIPGVVPDLLHSIVQAGILNTDEAPQILSRKLWQDQFRRLVNANRTDTILASESWRIAEMTIADLSTCRSCAASQHAVLGKAEDCFLKNKVLPYTEQRIKRVSQIFATVPVTYHLTIQCQIDYISAAMQRTPPHGVWAEPRIIPSWAELVSRIRAADPRSQIVVWDFERPDKMALAFLTTLLDVYESTLIEAIYEHLLKTRNMLPVLPVDYATLEMSSDVMDRLDLQYEIDLNAIAGIAGVSLILPKNIPEEFHL